MDVNQIPMKILSDQSRARLIGKYWIVNKNDYF